MKENVLYRKEMITDKLLKTRLHGEISLTKSKSDLDLELVLSFLHYIKQFCY